MKYITFYTWKLGKDQNIIIERIHSAIEHLLEEELRSKTIELASYGEFEHPPNTWGIKFGTCRGVIDPDKITIELPPLELLTSSEENKQHKIDAYNSIKILVNATKVPPEKKEIEHLCAVTKEGITVGQEGTDIQISLQEIEYAKKIKDLLGGCTIRITKGNITFEVE